MQNAFLQLANSYSCVKALLKFPLHTDCLPYSPSNVGMFQGEHLFSSVEKSELLTLKKKCFLMKRKFRNGRKLGERRDDVVASWTREKGQNVGHSALFSLPMTTESLYYSTSKSILLINAFGAGPVFNFVFLFCKKIIFLPG